VKGIIMDYKVIGKTCNCSGKPVNLILRTITEKEKAEFDKTGYPVPKNQAVMVCPECKGTVINWLFLYVDVETARWALKERYCFEPIKV
jgi:hypothetical protein